MKRLSPKMISFFGLYRFNTISTNLWPKEPVPPVTKIVLLFNIILSPVNWFFDGPEIQKLGPSEPTLSNSAL